MSSTIRGSDNFDSAYGAALKAWVNFNGTGTPAIRASLNVSSITDNGTGSWTVNLTNALSDANFCTQVCGPRADGTQSNVMSQIGTPTTTSVPVYSKTDAGVADDSPYVSVAVFR